jgi:hypothetical protein
MASGRSTLDAFFPGARFDGNVIVGGSASAYPPGNFFPRSASQVGFVDVGKADYRLATSSRFARVATDGKDPGVDFTSLVAAAAPAPSPTLESGASTRKAGTD